MTDCSLSFHCQKPSALSAAKLADLGTFIETHGGVPTKRVRHNLGAAFLIAWAELGEELVGASCLKHPRPEYLKNLCYRMDLNLEGFLERGYTCVHPQQTGQGIASRLVALLTEKAGDHPFYALVHENNVAIQHILGRSGQQKIKSFYSDLAKRELGLWVSQTGARKLGPGSPTSAK
jgi:GNAT superfamily N-acetyltransferase